MLVSKTDLRGVITYVNDVFCEVSGFTPDEMIGQPHNIIRNPDMPRCVFRLMWDTLERGQEIFVYVVNLAKGGGHYWVHAHVTASRDTQGKIVGYHSNRRAPYPDALSKVIPLYKQLVQEEGRHSNPKTAILASTKMLNDMLAANKTDWSRFVFGLSQSTCLEASI
jgi:PAS domain S-box-containing protein